MAVDPSYLETLKVFGLVFGPGGAALAVVAWLNRKPPAAAPPAVVAAPAPVHESPWLIQTLIEIRLEIEGIKKAADANTASVQTMSVQVNIIAGLLKRLAAGLKRRRKPGAPESS